MSRALVVRRGALGDFILTLPVIRALTTLGPVDVATAPRYAPLLPPGATWIDDAWLWRTTSAPADYTVAVAFGEVAADALRAAGLPDVRAVAPRPPPGVHAVDHYAGVLRGLPYDRAPVVTIEPDPAAFGRVVIAPGSGGRDKRWPLDRWRAVADALDLPVTWIRGPDEVEEPGWPADALCPDLPALAALAAGCAAWLGPDAGPSHLAAAVRADGGPGARARTSRPGVDGWRASGTVVQTRVDPGGVAGGAEPPAPGRSSADIHVIFGPTDPVRWAPVGATVWAWDTDPDVLAAHVRRVLRNPDGTAGDRR